MALIDRIKFDSPCTIDNKPLPWLVYKYPSEKLTIGSQLIVNESQEALFYKGGQACDAFGAGTHTLSTNNIPILQKLINLPFGGQTPFSAEIYYINKVAKLDMKWGTADPFPITDPRYGIIVNVRSFGQFGFKIADSRSFLTQLIGALGEGQATDYQMVNSYFKGLIVAKVKETIAGLMLSERLSVLDIAASLSMIADKAKAAIIDEFARFGIQIVNFFVESINIPTEDIEYVKKVLNEQAEFNILGDERYNRKRTFDIMQDAAQNSGTEGAVIGMGTGTTFGATMNQMMQNVGSKKTCPQCSAANPTDGKFCCNCGVSLQTSKSCPQCNAPVDVHAKFCSNCGAALAKKRCSCGLDVQPGAKFCSGCGESLGG